MREYKVRFRQDVTLKDALYNLHPNSGATVEYCIGLVVGTVATQMAQGVSFRAALDTVACYFPKDGRLIAPGSWLEDLKDRLRERGIEWNTPLTRNYHEFKGAA